jgi:hypothetical protein
MRILFLVEDRVVLCNAQRTRLTDHAVEFRRVQTLEWRHMGDQ